MGGGATQNNIEQGRVEVKSERKSFKVSDVFFQSLNEVSAMAVCLKEVLYPEM